MPWASLGEEQKRQLAHVSESRRGPAPGSSTRCPMLWPTLGNPLPLRLRQGRPRITHWPVGVWAFLGLLGPFLASGDDLHLHGLESADCLRLH